ncbi:MAG: hypothetical protein WCA92_21530 [Terriglobales bacterium]|jgi:hypothetical protein
MNYLDPTDYQAYGLEATTDAAWVTAASAMIDAHCRRPTLGVSQYTERLRVEEAARPVRLTHLPLIAVAPAASAIVSAQARYATPRRGEVPYDQLVWDAALVFGIPGTWVNLNVTDLDVFAATGEVTLPLNVLTWDFTEVSIVYTAGLDPIPNAVQVACALLVKNAQAMPALNVKKGVIDKMQLWYFSDTLMNDTVQELLAPFVAQKVG